MTCKLEVAHLPFVDLKNASFCLWCKNALPYKFVQKFGVIIFEKLDNCLKIAILRPSELNIIQSHITTLYPQYELVFFSCEYSEFALLANQAFILEQFSTLSKQLEKAHNAFNKLDSKTQNEAKNLLDFILEYCISSRCSDIHFESSESGATIRGRIDGMLQVMFELENHIFSFLSQRLRIECELDTTKRKIAQDGRFSRRFFNRNFDFRLSFMPCFNGESIVLRILDKDAKTLHINHLGLSDSKLDSIKSSVFAPNGIVFITGPTGSGKSTTLYAMLELIKSPYKKIITLEDPIEYQISLVTQVPINESSDFGFYNALRASLRQDPDVILIGEIRDEKTLQTAIRASLTGHLVLCTLHANDSISAVSRLLEMGADRFLLSSVLSAIISQRLLRSLCPHCKELANKDELRQKLSSITLKSQIDLILAYDIYTHRGCRHCNNSGYFGRILIAEILRNSSILQEFIKLQTISAEIIAKSFESMLENALTYLQNGQTSLEEIIRVCKI